jgi:cytochrome c-type biogenesis protein
VDWTALLWLSFLAGMYAPVGSPCIIALYPAYISFLAGGKERNGTVPSPLGPGIAVAAGVLLSMLAGGILFALLIAALGTFVRDIVTPAAFLLLLVLSLLLLFDIDPPLPAVLHSYPRAVTPHRAAFLLGLLMGFIILPCNAPVVMVLLVLAATAPGAAEALAVFLAFGAGMVLPLLVIAGISRLRSRQVTGFLTRHRLWIRRLSGLLMLLISAWYLVLIVFPGRPG